MSSESSERSSSFVLYPGHLRGGITVARDSPNPDKNLARNLVLSRCQCVDYSIVAKGCKQRRMRMEKGFHFMLAGVPRTGKTWACGNSLADRLEELDANEVRLAGFLLALDTRLDGGHPGRYQAG